MNGRIFYNNVVRNATVTVTNEAVTFEKKYLYDEMVGTKYRSASIAEICIEFDLYTQTPIEGIAVLDHNIEADDTTYLFESSDNAFSSVAESESLILKTRTLKQKNERGAFAPYTRRDAYYAGQWNRRYYRLRIQKASGNYIEIGNIYLFTGNYEFGKNYTWGYSGGFERNFVSVSNDRGLVFKKQKYSRRVFTLQFQGLEDAQSEIFDREIGENEFTIFLPGGYDGEMYYGSMEFDVPTHSYLNSWNTNASFTEII